MPPQPPAREPRTLPSIEEEELRGISRTVAEIHWLLLFLVLIYVLLGGLKGDALADAAISSGLFFYAALVVGFRYANVYRAESRWKIGIETVAMIALITWALRFTGGLESPLANTYLLPIITSALALGKMTTLAELFLIALCQAFLGAGTVAKFLSLSFLGGFVAQLAPLVLVAYVTVLFSSDIRYGLNRAKLLSQTDDLTGLYNRRGFSLLANRLFTHAQRAGRPVSMLMIDSDNLKAVNDSLGHEAGNQLLRRLARTISAELRFSDVAARYGGDEFVVLLQETPAGGAVEVAQRIRHTLSSTPFEAFGHRVNCTVSIGVAAYPEDGKSVDAVLRHADQGLYQAKQQGRDCVVRAKL